jgi:hypothetical protein
VESWPPITLVLVSLAAIDVFIINNDQNITFLGHTGPLIIVWALRPLNIVKIHYLKWGFETQGVTLPITIDMSSSSNHFGGTLPFKVQVNFDILIFEGQIDVDALEKWLNLLKGYFFVHNFSDRENITFVLLKALPNVKHW